MIIDEFKTWADSEDITYFEHNDGKCLSLHFKGKQANFTCFLKATDFPRRSIVFESSTGLKIPDDHYFAISELICRMNFGLRIGCKSALNIDPPSASNFDPPLAVILASYFWS